MLVAGMLVFACANDLEEINRVTSRENLPAQTILGNDITYTDSTVIQFNIKAGRIDRFPGEEPRDEFSEGVAVVSYHPDGSVKSRINAENATYFPEKKIMIARDSVTLLNDEGKKLNTELLTWDESLGKIYTDKFVRITTPTEILFGDGLDAEQDFSRYEIKNIKGRIKVNDNEKTE